MCKKHGSYTCRATLRNFAGNIATLLNFVRKIPTHVRIIPTLVEIWRNYSCTAKRCLALCAMCRNFFAKWNFNSVGIFPTKFYKKFCTCRNHASYTSVNSFQQFTSKIWFLIIKSYHYTGYLLFLDFFVWIPTSFLIYYFFNMLLFNDSYMWFFY